MVPSLGFSRQQAIRRARDQVEFPLNAQYATMKHKHIDAMDEVHTTLFRLSYLLEKSE